MATTHTALRTMHDWLQGKPLHHPLHPLLVHLPIGLWTLSLVFDAWNRLLEPANWRVQGAFYTLVFGIGVALLAAAAGLADWADIRADHPGKPAANRHMVLNLLAVGVFVVSAVVRVGALSAAAAPAAAVLLSAAALATVYGSGYLGGRLVYDEGIAVGRHRRPGEVPEHTVQLPEPQASGAFVSAVPVDWLRQHKTMRVQVNGYVMALIEVDGEPYAIQEFCTHRQGPLSEGRIEAGQVECPWHRSCFDIRTGKVTQGPAKVDLKTFAVRVADGMLQVKVPAEPPSHEQTEAEEEAQQPRHR